MPFLEDGPDTQKNVIAPTWYQKILVLYDVERKLCIIHELNCKVLKTLIIFHRLCLWVEAFGGLSGADEAAGEHPLWCHCSLLCYSCPAKAEHDFSSKVEQHFIFFLIIILIHIPQKCTGTLSTWYRSSPSASDTQYSHFVLKWPNWLEIMLQWQICRHAAGVNRRSPF